MNSLPTCAAIGFVAMLTACAERSSSLVSGSPDLPLQSPRHARQASIVDLDGTLHVGADVAAPDDRLGLVARHGDTDVSHGTVRDGTSAAEMIAYLKADAASLRGPNGEDGTDDVLIPDGLVLRFAAMPPTVRVAEGTPPGLVDETVRVVQAINAALPREWRLRFAPASPPADTPEPMDGEILVTFAPPEDWPSEPAASSDEEIGFAEPKYAIARTGNPEMPWSIEIVAGGVWIDPSQTAGRQRLGVIAHELIHLLGRGHVDPERFPATLMVAGGSEELSAHILHALDREALFAVYGWLDPQTSPSRIAEAFGPWSDTSMHLRGVLITEGGEVGFGVALRNGLSQPWAVGPTPESHLADNTGLSGSVRWSGRLLGLTPHAESVGGAAALTVDLTTLSGTLDFSELEHWPANAAPGGTGSGTAWRDGHLSYRIAIRGNSFIQTRSDAGEVTGTFFGPGHEGMGGVLVREDLSAGYGGRR